MLDFGSLFGKMFSPIVSFVLSLLTFILIAAISVILAFLAAFFISLRVNPFKLDPQALREPYIKFKWFNLLRWWLIDYLEKEQHKNEFREYGFTFFVGRQGAGKTASMVHYLEVIKERYPNCLIVTNFQYYRADCIMKSWRDFLTIRNDTDGVVFAIDEIQSEYDSSKWKDVPENLLSEISQQRKQRVKIVATSQFFTRVAKPLREQAFSVVACKTYLGRLTTQREYDALDYASIIDNPNVIKKKLKPFSKSSFIQSDAFRKCYDTYEKIARMEKLEFIPRNQRGNT